MTPELYTLGLAQKLSVLCIIEIRLGSGRQKTCNLSESAVPAQGQAFQKRRLSMKNIYVGNLDFNATEEQLRSLFAAHGNVEKVHIVLDRDTGQPRGFAFVEMTNDGEAE